MPKSGGKSSDVADHLDRAARSRNMAKIHSQNTTPELAVRKALHAAGYRFRLHRRDLPGKPDIVLPRHKMVVFVNGCFFHGHANCRKFRLPKSNLEYWQAKIGRNMKRDATNAEALAQAGWRVRVVWGCDVEDGIRAVLAELNSGTMETLLRVNTVR